jgi:hypothetical protein
MQHTKHYSLSQSYPEFLGLAGVLRKAVTYPKECRMLDIGSIQEKKGCEGRKKGDRRRDNRK